VSPLDRVPRPYDVLNCGGLAAVSKFRLPPMANPTLPTGWLLYLSPPPAGSLARPWAIGGSLLPGCEVRVHKHDLRPLPEFLSHQCLQASAFLHQLVTTGHDSAAKLHPQQRPQQGPRPHQLLSNPQRSAPTLSDSREPKAAHHSSEVRLAQQQ
jgi:hypothetical protein